MQKTHAALLALLKAFEIELHTCMARSDMTRLDALLHNSFRAFGRSGAVYSKAEILSQLPSREKQAVVIADRFEVRLVGEHVALLSYRSALLFGNGFLDRFALRSSIWERSPLGWKVSFHQGTPTLPFEFEPERSTATT